MYVSLGARRRGKDVDGEKEEELVEIVPYSDAESEPTNCAVLRNSSDCNADNALEAPSDEVAMRSGPCSKSLRSLASSSIIVLNMDLRIVREARIAGFPGSVKRPNTSVANGGSSPLCANSRAPWYRANETASNATSLMEVVKALVGGAKWVSSTCSIEFLAAHRRGREDTVVLLVLTALVVVC